MKSLIKCHYYYLISRSSIAIVTFVTIILGTSFITYGCIENDMLGFVARVREYSSSSALMVQIFLSFLFGFLFAYSFEGRNDHYCYLLLTSVSRKKYFASKMMLLELVGIILTLLILLLYIVVGFGCIPGFNLFQASIDRFVIIFFQANVVGLYCTICIQLIPHMMVIFIPFVLTLFGLSLDFQEGGLTRLFLWIFPNGQIPFAYLLVLIHYGLLFILLSLINLRIYEKKDLNY